MCQKSVISEIWNVEKWCNFSIPTLQTLTRNMFFSFCICVSLVIVKSIYSSNVLIEDCGDRVVPLRTWHVHWRIQIVDTSQISKLHVGRSRNLIRSVLLARPWSQFYEDSDTIICDFCKNVVMRSWRDLVVSIHSVRKSSSAARLISWESSSSPVWLMENECLFHIRKCCHDRRIWDLFANSSEL